MRTDDIDEETDHVVATAPAWRPAVLAVIAIGSVFAVLLAVARSDDVPADAEPAPTTSTTVPGPGRRIPETPRPVELIEDAQVLIIGEDGRGAAVRLEDGIGSIQPLVLPLAADLDDGRPVIATDDGLVVLGERPTLLDWSFAEQRVLDEGRTSWSVTTIEEPGRTWIVEAQHSTSRLWSFEGGELSVVAELTGPHDVVAIDGDDVLTRHMGGQRLWRTTPGSDPVALDTGSTASVGGTGWFLRSECDGPPGCSHVIVDLDGDREQRVGFDDAVRLAVDARSRDGRRAVVTNGVSSWLLDADQLTVTPLDQLNSAYRTYDPDLTWEATVGRTGIGFRDLTTGRSSVMSVPDEWQDLVAGGRVLVPPDGWTAPEQPTLVPGSVWSLARPPTWSQAGSELMPGLGWDSTTIATFPLRPGGERCAQVPEQALRDLRPTDALVSVFFTGPASGANPEWPSVPGFDDVFLPVVVHEAAECAERFDLVHHAGFVDHGDHELYVLVVFGPAVTAERRDETWRTLASLRPEPDAPASGTGPPCVVTRPVEPFVPPDPYPAEPTGEGTWYGTSDLWTVLQPAEVTGDGVPAWWSARFPGGHVEEQPDITVTWHRPDQPDVASTVANPGTNAYTDDTGWFMLLRARPDEPGCWQATATYRDASLTVTQWFAR